MYFVKKSISIEQIEANYCHSGRDGLVELSKQDYQLVVLDVMMPGMDGFETMEQIRKYSSIPILMLTSKAIITAKCMDCELVQMTI